MKFLVTIHNGFILNCGLEIELKYNQGTERVPMLLKVDMSVHGVLEEGPFVFCVLFFLIQGFSV